MSIDKQIQEARAKINVQTISHVEEYCLGYINNSNDVSVEEACTEILELITYMQNPIDFDLSEDKVASVKSSVQNTINFNKEKQNDSRS